MNESTILPPSPQIVLGVRNQRSLRIGGTLIDMGDLEARWKPATKYVNSLYSGSSYLGTPEASAVELSKNDPLAVFADNINQIPSLIRTLLDFDCHERRDLSITRKLSMSSKIYDPSSYSSLLYVLAS